MPSNIEIAWAAGFFDGEGCAYCRKHTQILVTGEQRQYGYLRIEVKQVERQPLQRFADAVGYGQLNGPYQKDRASQRPIWVWEVNNNDAKRVVEILTPYLSEPKLLQIKLALAEENVFRKRKDARLKEVV